MTGSPPAREQSHDDDCLFPRSYPLCGRQASDAEGDDLFPHTACTHSEHETTARDREKPRSESDENGSGSPEQVGHDHGCGDVVGSTRNEARRRVGVEALGEVRVIADAHDVKIHVICGAGEPQHLADLVDTGLQSETEEDLSMVSHKPIQSGSRSCPRRTTLVRAK